MAKQRRWLRPGIPAGAILFLLLAIGAAAGVPLAHAEENVVHIVPTGAAVAPGGTFHVGVVDDPTAASLAAWVLELSFDPAVVTTKGEDCHSITTPGGAIGAFDCETADTNGDGVDDTVKILGAVLFRISQKGLVKESTLADITFHAVGAVNTCSDLRLRILIHSDAEGHETGAKVQDGQACIHGDAPPTGTASAFPVTPRTSEPTPLGTGNVAITPANNDTDQPTEPGSTFKSGGASGSTNRTTPSGSPTTRPGGSTTGNDDGGTNSLVWVIGGLAVLVLAAGGAWGVVRMRGRGSGAGPSPGDGA